MATNVETDSENQVRLASLDVKDMKDHDLEMVTTTKVGEVQEYTDEQYKKLVSKIDRYLIPIMFFCYGIQQTDKTCISTQALFGMRKDVGLHGQQYQWLTSVYYLTYLVGEFPSTWLLQKWHLGRTLTIYMFGWSICLLCISACNNWSQLMALRALQGFFESNITPGFLMITGGFYRTTEHADRSLFWQSSEGFFSVVCNLILYGIARHVTAHGGIQPWRTIPLFLGALTFVGAIFCWFLLGTISEVKWLSKEEKMMAAARIADNQTGEESASRRWDWEQCREAFLDPQVWFNFFNTFLNCIPNGGITTFSSLMYVSFGFDDWQTMLYGLPRNAVYVVIFIAVAYYLRRFQDQRMYIMVISCILPMVGMLVMSLEPNTPEYKWIKWGMFMMTIIFSFPLFLGWSMIPSNVAGHTKRTVVSSFTLMAYCGGNMTGAQVFQTKDAPRYLTGTIVCTVCLGLETLVVIGWRLWYMYENRRRDKLAAAQGLSKEDVQRLGRELGDTGVTDRKNPHFRYAM